MSDYALFDVDRTVAAKCALCGARREAGEEEAPACEIDRARAAGDSLKPRPAACLNTYDPRYAPIPY